MTREKISLTNIFLRDAVYNIYVYGKVYTVKVRMIRYEFGCAAVPCPTCSSPRRPLPQNTWWNPRWADSSCPWWACRGRVKSGDRHRRAASGERRRRRAAGDPRPQGQGQRGQPSVQHPRLGEVVLKNWRQRGQGLRGQPSVQHPRLGEAVLMATRPRQGRGQPSVQHRRLGEVVFGKKKKKKIDDSAVQGHASGEVSQVRPSSTKCQSKRFLTSWRCWAGVIEVSAG